MKVTHKGKPGKLMSCGSYITFIPDDKEAKRLMIEPNYILEMLVNGLRITGYVRKGWTSKTTAETFTTQTHDFLVNLA